MPAKENPNQIRLDEAVINIGSGMSLVKDRDDLQPKNRYTLDSANSDFVQYTGNNTIPTGAPPAGVDTRVLLNGNRYDWNGTAWVLQPGATFDATVNFSVNANPNTIGTTFTPNTPGLTTVIYVSTIDGSQWTYNGSVYVSAPVSPDWKITGNAGTVQATNFVGTTDNVGLSFRTNNVIRQTIDNSGNVGIGITNPIEMLEVGGNIRAQTAVNQNASVSVYAGTGTTASELNLGRNGVRIWHFGLQASNRFSFVESGVAERLSILQGGNVGVGTIAPNSTFQVNGSQAGTVTIVTANITLNATHHKVLVRNGATAITITFPDALTCLGREYVISRAAGSTGTITLQSTGTNTIQALIGTTGATSSIGNHSGAGAGLRHSFTAINIGGIGVWVRI